MIEHDLLLNVQCNAQKLRLHNFALNKVWIDTAINFGKAWKIELKKS